MSHDHRNRRAGVGALREERTSVAGHGGAASLHYLRVLSVQTRLDVLLALAHGPQPVQDIADLIMLDRGHVSVHLGTLRRAELVEQVVDGRRRIYRHSACVTVRGGHMSIRRPDLRVTIPLPR